MKLRTQITLFFIMILIFSLGSMTLLSYYQMKNIFNEQLEDKLMNIAFYASEDDLVQNSLADDKRDIYLNEHIEKIRLETDVDFIVVFNMNGIRHTHPVEENIGKKFEGGDEERVLKKAEQYVSEAKGTLGTSIRAFVPVFHEGRQVGAVSVGSTLAEINKETFIKTKQFIPFIAIGLVLGICCAYILTSNIKYSILGLEPNEITLLFKEKETILENVKEGIITLNENGNLIQYNKEAARILGLTDKNMNMNVIDYIKENEIINSSNNRLETLDNIEVKIRPGVTILCRYNILKNDKDKVIGQVINFRDMTEMKKTAEELTGIRKMAWSLRAQNHEFMNKLHTISGLIQLEEYDEALKYISNTAKSRNSITEAITRNIKNVNIAALLLAKFYKAEEMRICLEVDKQSYLNETTDLMNDDDLGSVIGNLIENSLDAVNVDGTGKIYFKILEKEDELMVEIKDNGPGIPEEIREKVFERNFSTKTGQRGYGLYIVKNIIENANGNISLSCEEGTAWHVVINRKSDEII